jgi:hypothetical protein
MPTPIYSLPFHTIAQMRAVAGLLRAYIDDHAPDTNDGQDWTPPADLAEVSAAACHLETAIDLADSNVVNPLVGSIASLQYALPTNLQDQDVSDMIYSAAARLRHLEAAYAAERAAAAENARILVKPLRVVMGWISRSDLSPSQIINGAVGKYEEACAAEAALREEVYRLRGNEANN